ncbi:CC-NBS-LRR resistance protein [Trifolium pratense]|uniref:CC-NBS-LRR resistance protein n=1 Tax=Trifolium pratense TaxID=57577 RepID=A0A2K3MUQ6_TRIPR|nr:CC-NBS-LRR resistance protein [Trifolium pratense]
MAELVGGAFLSSFFQVAFEKLSSNDFIDFFRRNKLDEMLLEKLHVTLNSINHVLDQAETKQYQSMYVKKWLDELKHIAYEVDQLLDEIATDAPLKKLKAESQPSTSKVLGFFSSFTNPFESRIIDLLRKLELLAKQKDMLGLKQDTCASNEGGVSWKPSQRLPSTSLVDESGIYGRDDDKEEIIKSLLLDIDCGNQVPIVSIVGLGGMGKTTLAQLVYNDQRIKENFEHRAWVYVSETFDVIGLTKAILRSFHSSADGEDLNLLQNQLQQVLIGKKYLLVLDDVWNRSEECWERLLLPLYHGSTRSKIIMTTRNKEVASVMKSPKVLNLMQLNKSECWSMFVRHAFHGRNASDYPDLESIGEKILEKCGGLPLAVKTLGNLLRRKFSKSEWVKILETDLLRLSEGDSNINPILRLSYHNLSSSLKRCFAYCSIFPRGYLFVKDELIKLWMAEGLLKCCGTYTSEEELGNDFFHDLESISFFQQSIKRDDEFLVMHDLVNDLAKSVSGEFCLRIEGDWTQDIPERTRHIWCSLRTINDEKKVEQICKAEGLKGLTFSLPGFLQFKMHNNVQHQMFSRLRYLRMLSLGGCYMTMLSDEISNLKLLRYLDLSYTRLASLPDSICMLYNLQTLLLENCKLTELPSCFCKLINLRHLHLKGNDIKKMPKLIGRLNHLHTLTDFVVGEHSGYDIKELAELNHLQGTLHISGLENIIDPTDATIANLKDKKHLEGLHMTYGATRETDGSIMERDASVLESLQPNRSLKWLTIVDYHGTSFPNWLDQCHLPNLVSLDLMRCKFCTQLPPLWLFPYLKRLSISSCYEIEIISSPNVPFRSLEILRFEDMSNWKEWLCVEGFPLLKELSIMSCPKLKKALPKHLPSLEILIIINCQELESSIPLSHNIRELRLYKCENILINELPSNLKEVFLGGTRVLESYMEQILSNNVFLEQLDVKDFNGVNQEWSNLDLCSCNSIRSLTIDGWHSSSLPFAWDLFINLYSLFLYDCPLLDSIYGEGLPLSLRSITIQKCPKLIASIEVLGLNKIYSLEDVTVCDDFVESFPKENLLPPNINTLHLDCCSKLRIIDNRGFLHLKYLKALCITNCCCLEHISGEDLPESLSTLYIAGCPLLQCHNISHIPSVKIFE